MSESSQVNDESYCKCLQRSIIVTSWTSENPGRRFRSCSEYENGGCDFFSWVDPPMCNRSKQIIPGLLRKSNQLRAQNEALEDAILKMEDENKMLVLENKKLQLKLQEASSKMKDENKMLVLENKRLQLKLQEASSKMKDEKKCWF
ncbi:GRF zinc finger containing protein [Striga asiatica]|uniref:GRF zinc finger containing protein n=1 Tax=Striga asiatica TaxID=4170 RepID=A0A5A7QN14_STRAF|nr:GRF zinc finger containing protein [Striga asiatica]